MYPCEIPLSPAYGATDGRSSCAPAGAEAAPLWPGEPNEPALESQWRPAGEAERAEALAATTERVLTLQRPAAKALVPQLNLDDLVGLDPTKKRGKRGKVGWALWRQGTRRRVWAPSRLRVPNLHVHAEPQ